MATITASSVSTTDSLETFRQRFNTLRSDIQGLSFGASVVFEGATADDFETTLAVTDPTADRTVTIQDKTGILAMQGRDINDIVVMNASDGSGTDEAGAILLNASASGVDEGEALLYEEGVNDHILNPTFEGVEEFIILEESLEGTPSFALKENVDSSSLDARFAYQPATSDNLLGSLFIPPAAGGVQFIMPVSDGNNDQVLATDGSGNLSFKNQSSGMSLANDANNRVVTATGSGGGNGEANLTFDGSTLGITGAIDMSGAFDTDGVASAATFEPDGDTSTGDNAAIGYTSAEGLILTGQGSTNDVTIKNDADQDVIEIPTGTQNVTVAGTFGTGGLVTSGAGLVIADAGNIGSASDTDAISIASGGDVTFTQDIIIASGGSRTGSGQTENIIITNSNSAGDDTGIHMTAGNTGNSTIRFGAPGDDTLASILVTNSTNTATLKLAAGNGNTNITLSGTSGSELAVFAGDLTLGSDASVLSFGANSEIKLTHNHDIGLKMTSTAYAPLARRGEDVFIVLDQTAAGGTDAGDNVIMDRSADSTDVGDDIIGEDEVFLHSGMQRNVIEIRSSGGRLLNSLAGFAPGAI